MPQTRLHPQHESYVQQVKNYQQKCNFSSFWKQVMKLLTDTQEQRCAGTGSHIGLAEPLPRDLK